MENRETRTMCTPWETVQRCKRGLPGALCIGHKCLQSFSASLLTVSGVSWNANSGVWKELSGVMLSAMFWALFSVSATVSEAPDLPSTCPPTMSLKRCRAKAAFMTFAKQGYPKGPTKSLPLYRLTFHSWTA